MKYHLFLLLFWLSLSLCAQSSFEGTQHFITTVEVPETSSEEVQQALVNKYGDSLRIDYFSNGDLTRTYFNSDSLGYHQHVFEAGSGNLYISYRGIPWIDTFDLKKPSLFLYKRGRGQSKTVMDTKCKCVEYFALTETNREVVLSYCYSRKSPEVNPVFFSNYQDFFFYDYLNFSNKLFLFYSFQTEDFKISYECVANNKIK